MLLGYIFEVVKDHKLAEEYTAEVFTKFARTPDQHSTTNVWLQLQQAAKTQLTAFYQSLALCEDYSANYMQNTHVSQMSTEQRNIFCAVYYHGKTTADLAAQFNKQESEIRKTLREAFAFIKQRRER